jgi:hypothetical protein
VRRRHPPLGLGEAERRGGAIDPDISAEGSGQLQKGWAWVQVCVTTDEDLDAVQMAWAPVVVNS